MNVIKELWADLIKEAAFQHREQTKLLIGRARILEERLLKQQAARRQESNKFDPNAWYCTMKSTLTACQSAAKSKTIWVDTRQLTQKAGSHNSQTSSFPITRIHPPNIAVPSYNTYVGIDRSILSESNDRLLSHPLPLLEGAQVEEQLTEELPKIYSFSQTQFDRRAVRLRHDHQQMHLAPYVKKFLKLLQISEEDVLYMFFTNRNLPSESNDFERILTDADSANWPLPGRPKFQQPQPSSLCKWVFHRLKKPSIKSIAYAALACAAIDQLRDINSGFNSWEFFRRSTILLDLLRDPVPDPARNRTGGDRHTGNFSDSDGESDSNPAHRQKRLGQSITLCRVCHL